ncbi:MAG: hypothetical protein WAO55_00675 [Candidatus Manganitrophaceae bacterium]
MPLTFPVVVLLLLILFILANGVRILKEYERAVVFRLGRYSKDGAM